MVKNLNLNVSRGEYPDDARSVRIGEDHDAADARRLEVPTYGSILLDGLSIGNMPAHKRGIGMVFQNYALFPHKTVEENLAFPLQVCKTPKPEIAARIGHALEMVQLTSFSTRRPGQLSGGQQQRVALARALVFDPKLVLMDEPLGTLDKQPREQMQLENKDIHERLGITVVYVTHDQGEALTMSDRIAVFNDNAIQHRFPSRSL